MLGTSPVLLITQRFLVKLLTVDFVIGSHDQLRNNFERTQVEFGFRLVVQYNGAVNSKANFQW